MRMGYRFDGQRLDACAGRLLPNVLLRHGDSGQHAGAHVCATIFSVPDHVLFATDSPYDNQFGERVCRETIAAVHAMDMDDSSKRKIFEGNARRSSACRSRQSFGNLPSDSLPV